MIVVGCCLGALAYPKGGYAQLGAAVLLFLPLVGRESNGRRFPLAVLVMLSWICMTALWSINPSATLHELTRVVLPALAGLRLAARLPWRDLAFSVAVGGAGICGLSLAQIVIAPSTAWSPDGALMGVEPHANALGYVAACALVSGLACRPRTRARAIVSVCLVISLTTLVLSGAMTAGLAAATGLIAGIPIRLLRKVRSANLPIALGTFVAAIGLALWLIAANVSSLTLMVGRDPTFTGRIPIWTMTSQLISERPLLGYGLGAPWEVGSPIRDWFQQVLNFPMVSAHNAVLDTLLAAGVVGAVLVASLWLGATLTWFRFALFNPGAIWGLAMITFHFVHGLTESTVESPLAWAVMAYLWARREQPEGSSAP